MDELVARHRKELRDLQSRVTHKKKQASKKTRKGVNDECDRLEAELKAQHAAEIAALTGEPSSQADGDEDDSQPSLDAQLERLDVQDQDDGGTATAQTSQAASNGLDSTSSTPSNTPSNTDTTTTQPRKPNRQKARLARREADREALAQQAASEADSLPDKKQAERDRMLLSMREHKLHEKEIRADGHCLYSAVADQLHELGIPLGSRPDDRPDITAADAQLLPYKCTRGVAADYIEQHGDDFAGFLEEPLAEYVHKIRDTAEWGGQLELQALAKAYAVQINVLQDFGRVEKIEPDGEGRGSIWLGYYKHGFGLGEHYNSLRRTG